MKLLGSHVDDVEAIGRFLRVYGISGKKYVFVGGESLDAGLVDRLADDGHRGLTGFAQLAQHSLRLLFRYLELVIEQRYQFLVHAAVHDGLGYLRDCLGDFLKLDGLLLLLVA